MRTTGLNNRLELRRELVKGKIALDIAQQIHIRKGEKLGEMEVRFPEKCV